MVIDLYFFTIKMILINYMSLVYNCTERYKSHVLYKMTMITMIIVMAILLLLLLKKIKKKAKVKRVYKNKLHSMQSVKGE